MARQQVRDTASRHRRETWLRLILPMILLVLLIGGAVTFVITAPGASQDVQLSIVADLMLTIMILCPVAICMLPLTMLMLMAVVGLNRAHGALAVPLRKLDERSFIVAERAQSVAEQVNQKTIDVSARFGFVYKLLSTFEQQPERKEK